METLYKIGIIAIIIIIGIIIIPAIIYTYVGRNKISAEKAKQMIESGDIKYIIDVRTNIEWDAGHYKSALHIPIQEITKENIDKYNINKDDIILVYCNTGQRARYASEKIRSYGYSKVYYIASTYKSLE